MALTVKVENDAYSGDTIFEIVGLGAFTNGEEREVTEQQEKAFVSMYQAPAEETIGEDGNVTVSGSSSIENMEEVLGTDISDTIPVDVGTGTEADETAAGGVENPPQDSGLIDTSPQDTGMPVDEGGGS